MTNPNFNAFKDALKRIVSAPKSAVDAAAAREKLAKKRKASKKIQAGKSA